MALKHSTVFTKSKKSNPDDSTKQKLLDAGLEVFGRMGYEAATTRIIAQKAKVNLAAIPYHFGSKENLYNVVVQFIADTIAGLFQQTLKKIDELLADPDTSREALFGGLELALRSFGSLVVGSPLASRLAPIILREQMEPTPAFDRLYEGGIGQAQQAVHRLVARLLGRPEGDPEALVQAHAIWGQVMVFRAARELALRRMRRKNFSDDQLDLIFNVVIQNCRRIFELA